MIYNNALDHIPLRFIGSYHALLGISWGLGYIVGALLGNFRHNVWDMDDFD